MSIPCDFDPLGTLGGELPTGWTVLSGVSFAGDKYVDTGLTLTDDTAVSVEVTSVRNDIPQACFGGYVPNLAGSDNCSAWVAIDGSNHQLRVTINGETKAELIVAFEAKKQQYLFDCYRGVLKIGDSATHFEPAPGYRNNIRLYIAARSTIYNPAEYKMHGILHNFFVESQGVPVMRCIPALDPAGRVAFFDFVNPESPFYETNGVFVR